MMMGARSVPAVVTVRISPTRFESELQLFEWMAGESFLA